MPPLLAAFYGVGGGLLLTLDHVLGDQGGRLAAARERARRPAVVAAGAGFLAASLATSAFLLDAGTDFRAIGAVLAALTASAWVAFDGTWSGLLFAALVAVAAPASEAVILHYVPLWHYPQADVVLWDVGFVSWVPWCYGFYSPVLAAYSRLVAQGEAATPGAPGQGDDNVYESDQYVSEYLAFHYGQRAEGYLPYSPGPQFALDYVARVGNKCRGLVLRDPPAGGASRTRALDLGCAVGGASFEMARTFDEVVGVDSSQAFVDCCEELRARGEKAYARREEGRVFSDHVATVDAGVDRGRCRFRRGDACDLPGDLGQFDCVLLSNLLCRLPDPYACLAQLAGLTRPGGHVVVTSPFSWLEGFTAPANWLGGGAWGSGARGRDRLREVMCAQGCFELVEEDDVPFLIREHARKYQLVYSHCAVFRRLA